MSPITRRSSDRLRTHGGAAPLETLEPRALLAAAAVDDIYEPNDNPRQVNRADEGVPNSPNMGQVSSNKTMKNLRLSDKADMFRVRFRGAGTVDDLIRLSFQNRKGNLDLVLYQKNGKTVVAESRGNGNSERINLIGVPAGDYFIGVVGRNNKTNTGTYKLFINPPPRTPSDDAFESGNNTIQDVKARPAGAANSPNLGAITNAKTLSNLRLNDTWDVYRFELTDAADAPAQVKVDSLTPLDLIVTDAAGNILGSAEAYQGQTSISFAGLAPGEYFVHVSHYALGEPGSFRYGLAFTA